MKSCSLLQCLHSPDCDWNLWLLWRAAVVTSVLPLMIETVKELTQHKVLPLPVCRSKFYSLWNSWKLYKQTPVCSSWDSELVDSDNCSGFGEVLGYVIKLTWLQKLATCLQFSHCCSCVIIYSSDFLNGQVNTVV